MPEARESIREFFDAYATATRSLDLAFLESAYGDSFMFAYPGGVHAVKRDDFLKVVPKRGAFFKTAGLVRSEVSAVEEMRLDEKHTLVQTRWSLRFEKDPASPIVEETAATYVLRQHQGAWQIVFQLDHQDLTQRVQELGLLPSDG